MHSFKRLVFVVFVLFINAYDAADINCYDCVTGCNDPFDKGANKDKTKASSNGWCWKVKAEAGGQQAVYRGGGAITGIPGQTEPLDRPCDANKCESVSYGPGKFNACCCNTDLCNSAGRITMTVSLILTILFFIIQY